MIKAYLVGISTHYEGEDIEIRYSIYRDEELIEKRTTFHEFVKPAIVNQVALLSLLKELEKYRGEEITVIMNDAAINEQIKGTTQTKNKDVLKISRITRDELRRFDPIILIQDISGNKNEIAKWDEILQP
ncbi:hypothetical protein [Alkaliphilus transvaalensis]|uniref:hypothetical protein n=1 Tax=Alkaliphilus transvaalensis TaxID=114628 RepID=UPI000479ACBF|nr:hypothetical protein [Alkaliphilus transvaalensis]